MKSIQVNHFYSVTDRERVYSVMSKLQQQVHRAEAGEISFSQVFNSIDFRQCLAEYTVVPTSWHIDDLRDYFPPDISDDELFQSLQKIEKALSCAAIVSGWDVINDSFQK
ncbi:hypothetical protein M5X00_13105 [Paenibacillus alvei]|uniref:hypothetical protein n=1 Tax=Paenibacillus alvei TaxID=44250 RepID=UPI000289C1B9|nr:hypothetical protein [Paenibacillus alvei]EJW13810.1 hypothetical protein PAV_109p00400 [Paenibacillus alvei DSM 29]MCY9540536.1 hypothetical protein [Paenibacillus alvei]MCY9708259.1 hypothetical protein [Paenibacillus alvei]MCY9732945.1 hypothetical protein [Paenibacillus alvei]MCY9755179.1 hypothetical protein [Paenibacillus alvei]